MAVAGGGSSPAAENRGGRRLEYVKGKAAEVLESNINLTLAYIRTGGIENPAVYSKICMDLGSAIDAAIAMNEVPSSSHLLPLIFKEVYRRLTELLRLPLMLLVLSIKGACRIGWFSDKEKYDLLKMAREVSYEFCAMDKMSIEPSYAFSCVSNVMSRFYPKLKLDGILASFDVKAGYGPFVADFHLSRGTLPPNCRNLWLLVVRTDNMDTSACIIGPPKVDFLLNGKGIRGRTRNDMGKGPQLPSNVTKMIKFGVNLLQVLGDFDGQYIVVVAFMSLISSPDPPQLQDYVHPVSAFDSSDSDLLELSSRISLNCPISRHRIKTPVKGHLCKHFQCFDYKNFLEINSRRPFWRCPHCNQPVCHLDIRVDQNIVKILNEVAEDVDDVMISADGSWKAILVQRESTDSDTLSDQEGGHKQCKPSIPVNHVVSAAEKSVFVEANPTLRNSFSALHSSVTSIAAHNVDTAPHTVRTSALWQSPVTTDAVSSARLRQVEDYQQACGMLPSLPNLTSSHMHSQLSEKQHTRTHDQRTGSWQNPSNLGTFMHANNASAASPTFPCGAQYNWGSDRQQQSFHVNASSVSATVSSFMRNHFLAQDLSAPNDGSYSMVETPPSLQQNREASNESTRFAHAFAPGQSQHVHTNGTIRDHISTTQHAQSTMSFAPVLTPPSSSSQARSTVSFAPVRLTPPSTSSSHTDWPLMAFEQLRRGGQHGQYIGQPLQVQRDSREQVTSTTQQSQHVIIPPSPFQHTNTSGDGTAMPSGRMRGSLRGNDLVAAQRQFLAPPRQPARANQPWSNPARTVPIAVQMQEIFTNATSTTGAGQAANIQETPGSLPRPSQGMH